MIKKDRVSNNITSEAIMRNCDNRFKYINEIIKKAHTEIYDRKISGTLDDAINIADKVIFDEFQGSFEEKNNL